MFRKVLQVCDGGRGAERSTRDTVRSETTIPSIFSSPWIQGARHNGIYLIDDFGRQKATPAEILNRWIVPMERHIDYLTFQAGGKMTVPFEAFLIFSTNLNPTNLGDEAFLRRIQYKMFLRSPKAAEFLQIFDRFSKKRTMGGMVTS